VRFTTLRGAVVLDVPAEAVGAFAELAGLPRRSNTSRLETLRFLEFWAGREARLPPLFETAPGVATSGPCAAASRRKSQGSRSQDRDAGGAPPRYNDARAARNIGSSGSIPRPASTRSTG
jgi:hypothetical protein